MLMCVIRYLKQFCLLPITIYLESIIYMKNYRTQSLVTVTLQFSAEVYLAGYSNWISDRFIGFITNIISYFQLVKSIV